jgi:tetratricopeptide (TPR) repeat protein
MVALQTDQRGKMRNYIILLMLCMVVGVPAMCFAGVEKEPDEGLASCISYFKNGEYEKAIECLALLILYTHNGEDSIAIYKYLGFSNGMLGRIDRAKENFNNALNKLPDMQIDTLECPPNISIIFNQVKLERKIAKIDTAAGARRVEVRQKKNPLIPVLLLTVSVASAGAGGYYYYSGNTLRDKYRSLDAPDQALIDKSYNNFKNAYIKSAVCFGISAVFLPVSIYLYLHKGPSKYIAVSAQDGVPSLVYSF